MVKKKSDKSEEYHTCELCKIDCSKEKDTIEDYYENGNWYIRYDCKYHKIKEQLTRLSAHYCLEHNQFHCAEHRDYCMKVYGKSVMNMQPENKSIVSELEYHNRLYENEDAELCRLRNWEDQIEFGIIKCAECDKTACMCHGFGDMLVVKKQGYEIEVDEWGNREAKKKNQAEYELVDQIISDHYQKTGYSLDRGEVLKKLRKGELEYISSPSSKSR